MLNRAKCYLVALGLLSLGLCRSASAGVVTDYSDRTAFDTAIGVPVSVEDFGSYDRFPITTGSLNSATNLAVANGPAITPGLILPGVTYSTPIAQGNFFNIDAGAGFNGGFLDRVSLAQAPLTATFDSAVNGFGFDTNTFMGNTLNVTIHFSSGPDQSQSLSITGPSFFGFVSSATDIQSVAISADPTGSVSFAVDNFTYATPNAVPEPSSLALLGIAGLSGLAYARRRRLA